MMRSVFGLKYIVELEQSLIPAPVNAMLFEILVELKNTSVDPMASMPVQLLDSTTIPSIPR